MIETGAAATPPALRCLFVLRNVGSEKFILTRRAVEKATARERIALGAMQWGR
jgi:hypothetical protein